MTLGAPRSEEDSSIQSVTEQIGRVEARYGRPDRAVGGYLPLLGAFALVGAGAVWAAAAVERRPEPMSALEIGLMGLATHKVSRIIAKDAVTSPVRAPFTRFAGSAGNAELKEDVVGRGLGKAAGELLTCPFCLAPWVAMTFTIGHVFAPRATRAATELMSAVAMSDGLQLGYDALRRTAE